MLQWVGQAPWLDRHPVRLTSKQFRLFRKVREELHRRFHSLAQGVSPSGHLLAPLSARLATIAPNRQILHEKGALTWGWDLARYDPDRILAAILCSAAELLVSGHGPRVRQCEDATCGWPFLGRSQGRPAPVVQHGRLRQPGEDSRALSPAGAGQAAQASAG